MKALLLAAGRGERMRPLTDDCPKPLLRVGGTPLIEWHLQALARAGVRRVVVNTAWLEDKLVAALGDGARFGLRIDYSMENRDHGGALETAGGLKMALPLLLASDADDAPAKHAAEAAAVPAATATAATTATARATTAMSATPTPTTSFWYVAADVFAPGFGFSPQAVAAFDASDELARLWLVPNPPQHPLGDFGLEHGRATAGTPGQRLTWSGIGLFRPAFVSVLMGDLPAGAKARLRPYLDAAIARRQLGAEIYPGPWADVGTPQRLAALQHGAAAAAG